MADPVSTKPGRWQPRPRPLLRTMVGDVLRRTRLAQGRTLADVARAARVSVPYLSELERGRKEASSEVLAAICDGLRIGLPGLLAELGRELAPARELPPAREAADAPAQVIRLGTAGGSRISPAVRRSGDAQCLLAA
jgi:transcriptional regulator with XRE-family HTH domain